MIETIAWVILGTFVTVILVLAFGMIVWALRMMWRDGRSGRVWAIATVVIPVIVTWALWTVARKP